MVPAYNEALGIEAAVRSLARSDYADFEVIVVDDGSTDDTLARLHSLVASEGLSGVEVMHQSNAGKARALNAGLARATGDVIVTVDGDTVFEPDTLGLLVQQFHDEHVGAVSGNTKVANRKGLLGRWQHVEYVMGFNLDRRMYHVLGCMPTVPGAIGAFRARALADVGGFSDDTLAEDTDITMALHRGLARSCTNRTRLRGPKRHHARATSGGSATAGHTERCKAPGNTRVPRSSPATDGDLVSSGCRICWRSRSRSRCSARPSTCSRCTA